MEKVGDESSAVAAVELMEEVAPVDEAVEANKKEISIFGVSFLG